MLLLLFSSHSRSSVLREGVAEGGGILDCFSSYIFSCHLKQCKALHHENFELRGHGGSNLVSSFPTNDEVSYEQKKKKLKREVNMIVRCLLIYSKLLLTVVRYSSVTWNLTSRHWSATSWIMLQRLTLSSSSSAPSFL